MRKKSFITLYIVLLFIFVCFIVMSFFVPGQNLKLSIEKPQRFNNNWQIHAKELSLTDENTLPLKLPVAGGTKVSLSQKLNDDFLVSQSILIRGSLQNVVVFLDESKIYEKLFENSESKIVLPYASIWHIIDIPDFSAGKTLTIELSSPFDNMSGQVNDIYYGKSSQLQLFILKNYSAGFILTLIIFIAGILLAFAPIFFLRDEYSETSAVGLFAIIISIYLLAEGKMLNFFTGNQFIIGSLAYITLSLIPAPLLIYMKSIVDSKYRLLFKSLTFVHILNVFVIIFLQLSGLLAFFDSLIITHILLVITALTSIYILFYEATKRKNADAKVFLQGLLIMVCLGFIELFYFYFVSQVQVSFFLRTGVVLFVFILTFNSIRRIGEVRRKSLQADLYETLAYTDQLTKAPNRMAFDRDLHIIYHKENQTSSIVGIFDLNNLKKINDIYGHKYGDEAIIKSVEVLKEVFSEYGTCYRIGGDEFACILDLDNQNILNDLQEKFNEHVKETGKTLFYPFVIAQGYARIEKNEQTDIDSLIHKADQNMYQDKNQKKAACQAFN